MNEVIDALLAALREGIVVEQTETGAVRIRLEHKDDKDDKEGSAGTGVPLGW